MGFFTKMFTAEPVQYKIVNEAEACAAILVACLHADGDSSTEESASIYTSMASRSVFIGKDVIPLIERAMGYLRKVGSSAGLIDAALSAIQQENRIPLFLHCVDIILADGQVTKDESDILDYLKDKFNVDDATAQKAIEILMLKNRL